MICKKLCRLHTVKVFIENNNCLSCEGIGKDYVLFVGVNQNSIASISRHIESHCFVPIKNRTHVAAMI